MCVEDALVYIILYYKFFLFNEYVFLVTHLFLFKNLLLIFLKRNLFI